MNENKKKIPKWALILGIVLFVIFLGAIASSTDDTSKSTSKNSSSEKSTTATQQQTESATSVSQTSQEKPTESQTVQPEYNLQYGELLSTTTNNIDGKEVIVIKAKIESSLTNTLTINKNYYNVADMIKNQGCDKFDEIQYWAVADMTSGNEAKVISFTLNSDIIKQIKGEKIVDIQIGDYADDLWILPSLKN